MKDLGAANYILGMEIKRDWAKKKLWLNQRKYVETILQRFNMQDSKSLTCRSCRTLVVVFLQTSAANDSYLSYVFLLPNIECTTT